MINTIEMNSGKEVLQKVNDKLNALAERQGYLTSEDIYDSLNDIIGASVIDEKGVIVWQL